MNFPYSLGGTPGTSEESFWGSHTESESINSTSSQEVHVTEQEKRELDVRSKGGARGMLRRVLQASPVQKIKQIIVGSDSQVDPEATTASMTGVKTDSTDTGTSA